MFTVYIRNTSIVSRRDGVAFPQAVRDILNGTRPLTAETSKLQRRHYQIDW
jgi:hypothetical protein